MVNVSGQNTSRGTNDLAGQGHQVETGPCHVTRIMASIIFHDFLKKEIKISTYV